MWPFSSYRAALIVVGVCLYYKCVTPHHRKIAAIVSRLLEWYSKNARDLPWRREPYRNNPYCVYVSEVMLQQTQVKTVLPYWERWMRALPDVRALAKASPQKIHKLWEGLGYYTRVRNMQRAAQIIVSEQGGEFPREFDAILALPGIGRYTAGAICSIAFNQPTPILDGNVIRVLTRLFGIKGNPREKKTNAKLWQIANDLVKAAQNKALGGRRNNKSMHAAVGVNVSYESGVGLAYSTTLARNSSAVLRPRVRGARQRNVALPSVYWPNPAARNSKEQSVLTSAATNQSTCSHLNQSLMELGALVCTPKNPRCAECPLKAICVARSKNIVHLLPKIPRRAPTTSRHFLAFVIKRNSRYLVRQRPADVVNAHLWEFPNVEANGESDLAKIAKTVLAFRPESVELARIIKHTITRYRITLKVFQGIANGNSSSTKNDFHWLTPGQLRLLPFASAHKKILDVL